MDQNKMSIEIEGKELIFETGKIARQANGSIMLHVGDTTILTTACATKTGSEEIDFLPLTSRLPRKITHRLGKHLVDLLKEKEDQNLKKF